MSGILQVVPVGATARELVKELTDPIAEQFGVEVHVGAALAEPAYAFNKDRGQHHSTAILRRLASVRVKEHAGIIGVAEVDLFIPDIPFVFGEADRESRTAIISLHRLRPEHGGAPRNNDLLRTRGRAELVHEAGHLAGLSHCDDVHCAMYLSTNPWDSDRKGHQLCHDCRGELARIAALK